MDLEIKTPAWALPLLNPARYKGAKGGRGSGKSHFFAELAVEEMVADPDMQFVCIREVQKSLKFSAKKLVEDKIQALGVGHLFNITLTEIRRLNGRGIMIFQGMQDHTADSIKSLEGFHRAWVEEAQNLSPRSLELLRPTIRAEGSEIWFSWNPDSPDDPVDAFMASKPPGSVLVHVNYTDNPFLPETLRDEMQVDKARLPESQFRHIWEGAYRQITDGAVYADELAAADKAGRICRIPIERMPVYTFWDLGRRDTTAIWFMQQVGLERRFIDYYEACLKDIPHYAQVIKEKGYDYGAHYLPHDAGYKRLDGMGKSLRDLFEEQGLKNVKVGDRVPNKGLAIQAVRRVFPSAWFDGERCAKGLKCLRAYRYEWDEDRKVWSKEPCHDWASHGSDAFAEYAMSFTGEAKAGWSALSYNNRGII